MRFKISLVNATTRPPATVSIPLALWLALEAETQLKDSEAQQDHAVSPDQGEDEVGQIVHRRQRVAGGESRDEKDGE